MGKDFEPLNRSSRIGNKTKDRKANRVYNILIVVVSIAIVVVAATIFLGGNDHASKKADVASMKKEGSSAKSKKEKDKDSNMGKSSNEKASEDESNSNQDESDSNNAGEEQVDLNSTDSGSGIEKPDDTKKTEVPDDDPNVKSSSVNESWQPVGTQQQGEHVTTYDQNSVDWKEMEKALAYGAGIDGGNMTVWRLQNDGSPDRAVGTISPKDNRSKTYRVHIEWVDGQGWKPVKVQELKVNDKAQ